MQGWTKSCGSHKQTYSLSFFQKTIEMLVKYLFRRVAGSFEQKGYRRWQYSILSTMSLAIQHWPTLPHPTQQISYPLPSSGGSLGNTHGYSWCLQRWSASPPPQAAQSWPAFQPHSNLHLEQRSDKFGIIFLWSWVVFLMPLWDRCPKDLPCCPPLTLLWLRCKWIRSVFFQWNHNVQDGEHKILFQGKQP